MTFWKKINPIISDVFLPTMKRFGWPEKFVKLEMAGKKKSF